MNPLVIVPSTLNTLQLIALGGCGRSPRRTGELDSEGTLMVHATLPITHTVPGFCFGPWKMVVLYHPLPTQWLSKENHQNGSFCKQDGDRCPTRDLWVRNMVVHGSAFRVSGTSSHRVRHEFAPVVHQAPRPPGWAELGPMNSFRIYGIKKKQVYTLTCTHSHAHTGIGYT